MSAEISIDPIIDASHGRAVPTALVGAGAVMMLVGLLAIAYGFLVAGAAWTWGALVVGLVYTFAIAQGGVMFSVLQTGTWGRWGRPFKRIAETFFFAMPFAYVVLALFLLLGGLSIYVWNPDTIIPGGMIPLEPHSSEAVRSKPIWLTTGFVSARLLLGFAWIMLVDFIYIRASLGPDLLLAKQRLGGKAPGWWNLFIGGHTDVQKAVDAGQRTQSNLAPIIGISYAAVFTIMAMDLLMSLSPLWYSNMFPGWIAVSSFWMSLAALAALSMLLRDWLGLRDVIRSNNTHDLGKFMLAGCMFWGYTTFAQILPIYYTNMPEETEYLLVRMVLPTWSPFSQLVAITCFVAPFTILLSRGIKKMRWPFFGIAMLIMTGIFFERSLLVMPQVFMGDEFPLVNFVIVYGGVWIGAMGLVLTVVTQFLARVPAVVISDPHLGTHPWDVHVSSLDAVGHAHH